MCGCFRRLRNRTIQPGHVKFGGCECSWPMLVFATDSEHGRMWDAWKLKESGVEMWCLGGAYSTQCSARLCSSFT
jgi:hypothetical protein